MPAAVEIDVAIDTMIGLAYQKTASSPRTAATAATIAAMHSGFERSLGLRACELGMRPELIRVACDTVNVVPSGSVVV